MDDIQNKELQPLMVSIKCLAYNHGKFIRETLEGFVMQKTNFRFEAIVHDDASTDNTAEIIREYAEKYPEIIKPIYETENQYSKKDGSLQRIMDEACNGKYIAFCEGDDYWIDPYKLQKQVDIFENNNKIGLVFSKVDVYDELKKEIISDFGDKTDFFKLLDLGNSIPTLSVCIRAEIYNSYINEIKPWEYRWKMGDYPLWLYTLKFYESAFIDSVMGVYRKLPNSASHSNCELRNIDFLRSYRDIRLFFFNHFNVSSSTIRRHIYSQYISDVYKVVMDNSRDISIIKKELQQIPVTNLKITLMKLALLNRYLNDRLYHILVKI